MPLEISIPIMPTDFILILYSLTYDFLSGPNYVLDLRFPTFLVSAATTSIQALSRIQLQHIILATFTIRAMVCRNTCLEYNIPEEQEVPGG
ncbi:hypothetical protein ACJX0J_032600, partial [Zea mays]